MKYCGVVTLAILATIAVVSNGAPESSSDRQYGPPPPPPPRNGSGQSGGMRFDGSFQGSAQESASSRFLVKRDLASEDSSKGVPPRPHVHTAACRGNNRPPPANITSA